MARHKSVWGRNHARRAAGISKAFVKSGSRGYTVKGHKGFLKKKPFVW